MMSLIATGTPCRTPLGASANASARASAIGASISVHACTRGSSESMRASAERTASRAVQRLSCAPRTMSRAVSLKRCSIARAEEFGTGQNPGSEAIGRARMAPIPRRTNIVVDVAAEAATDGQAIESLFFSGPARFWIEQIGRRATRQRRYCVLGCRDGHGTPGGLGGAADMWRKHHVVELEES